MIDGQVKFLTQKFFELEKLLPARAHRNSRRFGFDRQTTIKWDGRRKEKKIFIRVDCDSFHADEHKVRIVNPQFFHSVHCNNHNHSDIP